LSFAGALKGSWAWWFPEIREFRVIRGAAFCSCFLPSSFTSPEICVIRENLWLPAPLSSTVLRSLILSWLALASLRPVFAVDFFLH
jgi:hypothetical protein